MTREHSPQPSANWDTHVVRAEQVVPDEPYRCRHCGHALEGHGTRYHHRVGLHTWQGPTLDVVLAGDPVPDTTLDGLNDPQPPRLNRRQRRAQQHANRRKGQQR